MDRLKQKSKKDKPLKYVERDKSPLFITDVKTIKENLKIKEILRTVKMNSSMRIKAPRGSKVMQNKDFNESDDIFEGASNSEVESSGLETASATNPDVVVSGNIEPNQDVSENCDVKDKKVSEEQKKSEDRSEEETVNESNNNDSFKTTIYESTSVPEGLSDFELISNDEKQIIPMVPNITIDSTPLTSHTKTRDRKLSLDQTMLSRREGLSQSELDLNSIGKSPLERKSSFFRKKMDSFVKNTTEMFKRQSNKSQPIQRRGSMSVSLQSLNENSTFNGDFNGEPLYKHQEEGKQGSVSSSRSSLMTARSTSSVSVSQSERTPDMQSEANSLAGSRPALATSQPLGDVASDSVNSFDEAYYQESLLTSRAISMSSGLDTAHGPNRRKNRMNRVTWLASEGLTNYLRRIIQDENNSEMQASHSYQDISTIPQNNNGSKMDTKGRRLSYQRAVSGEDPRYLDSTLRRKQQIKESPEPSRASKIIALVPNEHAPSDASEVSDTETELHERTNTSSPFSSPAPSISASLADINISSSEDDESNTDIIPDSIVREIGESNYENVPSLSAIPSLPCTPATPIASTFASRKTRSRKPSAVKGKRKKKAKKFQLVFKWKVAQFHHRATAEEDNDGDFIDLPGEDVDSPLNFFYQFFSQEVISVIVDQTNLYSVQETGKSIQMSEDEFRDFLAIHIIMGIVVMPSYLDYWSEKFRYAKIADIMSLKRYQQIRRYLHFVDNNMDDGDKYYKVRPVVEQIRQNCLKLQNKESKFSIDEMMIAYKGSKAGKRKQYMKDKPNKWGFKNYVRAGISGIIYDFVLYGGDDTFRYHTFNEEESSLGFGAQVVIALCQSIEHKPAFVFCDNFFSSPELFFILRQNYGIFALGTIRSNRLRGAETVLPTEKTMKKKPRGQFAQAVCDRNRLAIVRWNDNKAVTLISSFVASEPVDKIRRYSKEHQAKVDVQCPQIVRQYNKHMGGVDLADMLISLYKTPFKSRRWYLAIFAQMIDICVNNAWLLYRRKHSKNAKIPLKEFRYEIYENLVKANRCIKRNKSEVAKITKPCGPSIESSQI